MKRFLNWISTKWVVVYVIWLTLHSLLLLLEDKHRWADNYFFPRIWMGKTPYLDSNSFRLDFYDLSEFLVYTIVPILIALAIYIFKVAKINEWKDKLYDVVFFVGGSFIVFFSIVGGQYRGGGFKSWAAWLIAIGVSLIVVGFLRRNWAKKDKNSS